MKSTRFLPFLTLLVFASCKSEPETAVTENSETTDEVVVTKEQFQHNNMELGELTEVDFPQIVRATGQVEVPPENQAKITVFEGGYVKRVPKLEGSKVEKGDLILSLENPRYVELQQEYLELVGQLKYLKSEFERQRVMLEEKITSEKSFFRAESEYKSGLARFNALRKKLQMLNLNPQQVENGMVSSQINVYAPISGTVDKVNVTTGSFVEPAYNIMEIVNPDHLHLKLNVFEKDLMKIREGQKLLFSLPQAAERSYEAKVYLVGKTIDENRMASVHAHMADSLKDRLAVGMFVEAEIITASNTATALPENAITEVGEAHYVLVLKKEDEDKFIFTRKAVEPQSNFNGFTAIQDPESMRNKKLLTRGAFDLFGN